MNTPLRTALLTAFGLVSAAILAGPVSCAAVVGADDYQVSPTQATGSGTGQSAGGSDGTGGSNDTGGTRLGTGGDNRRLDASPSEDAPVITKPETGVTPPKSDAKSDVVVPDAGNGSRPVGSGETVCVNACPVAGLTCQHTALGTTGICTYLCNDVSECDSFHDCIGSSNPASKFDYACLQKCPNGKACPGAMTCVPLPTGPVCLPTEWLPHDLGLGDDCLQDEQCVSHQCVNKPNGWCTRPCQSFDLCPHDPVTDENYYGEYNWCVNVFGGYKCAPGCTRDPSVCANYPGTTCKRVIDIDSFDPNVCSP